MEETVGLRAWGWHHSSWAKGYLPSTPRQTLPLLPKGKLTWIRTTLPPNTHLRVAQDTEKERAAPMGRARMLGSRACRPRRTGLGSKGFGEPGPLPALSAPCSALFSGEQRFTAELQPAPGSALSMTEIHVRKQPASTVGQPEARDPVGRQAAPEESSGPALPLLLCTVTPSPLWQVVNDTNRDKMGT